jgi:predicted dehydrogenase
MTEIDRRKFITQATAAGIGLGLSGRFSPLYGSNLSGPSMPASDRVVVGVMGVNSRGSVLAQSFAASGEAEVAYICDPDSRAVAQAVGAVSEPRRLEAREGQPPQTLPPLQEQPPQGVGDFRRILDDRDVDALVIAAPDHWHAPATILALQAGKHVYVEKPCGHNPHEGELLVEAQRRYDRVVQMGNQQRSSPETLQAIQEIRAGIIGRPYFGRAWYGNSRGPIGHGKIIDVPPWLDYELWQGPAPRTPYRDNVVHYNWHWFWRWGTGEICNNGTHEIDVCAWALDVAYPVRASSAGGRYHFDDDWEAFDTQIATFDFEGGKTIAWEGRSCNARGLEGRGRGASIHGQNGTVIIDRNGYVVYDNENNETKKVIRGEAEASLDTRGGGSLTDLHIANFLNAIRGNERPTAPIDEAHRSVLLCHLGNIAQRIGRTLKCDPNTGRILGDEQAMGLWSRSYAAGWEPKL